MKWPEARARLLELEELADRAIERFKVAEDPADKEIVLRSAREVDRILSAQRAGMLEYLPTPTRGG